MSKEDKIKWDGRYQNNPIPNRPIKLVVDYAKKAKIGRALDIACGMGRHSKYLASLGFKVDALDISSVAINNIRNIPNIYAQEVDFDSYELERNHYELIVCTFFLDRKLFPQIINALKGGGIFIYESFVYHHENQQKPSNDSFLLKDGEIESFFKNRLKFLHLEEYWDKTMKGNKMKKVSFVGKMD